MEEKVNAISQEVALFQSRQLAQNNEVGKQLKKLENDLWAVREDLASRIKILEEARLRQIQLNSRFETAITYVEKNKISQVPKRSFWDFFKK